MAQKQNIFQNNQPFHIISRAVEERKIFDKEDDCYRFIFQIYAANIGRPIFSLWRKDIIEFAKSLLRGEEISSKFIVKEYDPLVNILDFSLVINHYHFCLVSNTEDGIPIFMKKLNGGFAKYYNLKYNRKGSLFGGRYKRIPIKTEFQSNVLSRYINIINPLDVYQPGWREDGLKNTEEAFDFLKNYSFSSFPDKMQIRKSKIIASKEILDNYCSLSTLNKKDYSEFVANFLKERISGPV